MTVRRVGLNQVYTTIQSAVDVANDEDTILIDPGVYEEAVTITKLIHLRGTPVHPEDGDVRIVSTVDEPPVLYDCLTMTSGTVYIEGLEIECTFGNWQRAIKVDRCNSTHHFRVNKCRLLSSGYKFPFGLHYDYCGSVYLENCYLQRGFSHVVCLDYALVSKVLKTECNNVFYAELGDPDIEDTVYYPSSGYGPAYGDYYLTYDMYYFTGHVREEGVYVSRAVKAYSRDDNSVIPTASGISIVSSFPDHSGTPVFFMGSSISDENNNGHFYVVTTYSGEHTIVCEDSQGGADYNDLVFSNIYPLPIYP